MNDLTIKAIGRNAQLGSLYDAYNEKIISGESNAAVSPKR